jgi:predicted metallopeptidase
MIKNIIKNWLLKNLLNAVVVDDVITKDKLGNIYLGEDKLTDQEKINIYQEVEFIEKTRIWKVYTESLKQQAEERIFNHSKTLDDMFAGKMMLYNLDVILKINKIFKR